MPSTFPPSKRPEGARSTELTEACRLEVKQPTKILAERLGKEYGTDRNLAGSMDCMPVQAI